MKLRPSALHKREEAIYALGPTLAYAIPGWLSCIRWATADPIVLASFTKDIKSQLAEGKTLADMLDIVRAEDKEFEFLLTFIQWVNKNVWGEIDGHAVNGNESEPCS
jgi:hypothetical protein